MTMDRFQDRPTDPWTDTDDAGGKLPPDTTRRRRRRDI
jgi:hypothetical protein